jgi:hypothetical protein
MSTKSTFGQRMFRYGGPVFGIVVLYLVVFALPLRRSLNERLAKHHKLEELVRQRAPDHAARTRRLAALEAEQSSLVGELETHKKSGAHLVTQRDDRKHQLFSTTSPAALLARTLELLGRHRLECLDSSILARATKAQGDPLESLKPVADLLGVNPGEESGRRQVRITLTGRFQDLQNAVHEIQRELSGAFIVSLEMEPSEAHTMRQLWILTLSV